VPIAAWGALLTVAAAVAAFVGVGARRDAASLFLCASVLFAAIFFLMTRMHERYRFPAYPFVLLAWSWAAVGRGLASALSWMLTANLVYGSAYLAQFPRYEDPVWSAVCRAFTFPVTLAVSVAGLATLMLLLVAQRARRLPQRASQSP